MEDPEVDRLYELPLEQFTPSRDALAARLKTAGDADESRRIKGLRKPTAPAWAVNQLARRYPKQVETLIGASDRLRRAQQELLEGASAGDLWEASMAEREAVGELLKAAEWILKESGLGASRAALDRVAGTLYAAAADPTGRSLLRRGLITQEMRRAGFGELEQSPAAVPRAKSAAPAKRQPLRTAPPAKGKAATGPTAKVVLEAERAAQRAAREADRAEEDAERLERAHRRADDEATQARKRADAAARASGDAEAEAVAARRAATHARREAGRAEARLDKLRASRG
jgi:hypothetical protein